MSDQLKDFPLAPLLVAAEENIRLAAERLNLPDVRADDPEVRARLADTRIWLLSAVRRIPD